MLRVIVLIGLMAPSGMPQAVWHVQAGALSPGTGAAGQPFPNLAAALQAAGPGDLVLVGPGIYGGTLDFLGKAVRVRATGPAAATVLDGLGQGPVVRFVSGEGPGARLEGFTVTGGVATSGGGILIGPGASPTIQGCRILGNVASLLGGGVAIRGPSSSVLEACILESNSAESGGGIHIDGAAASILRCSIFSNGARGPGGGIGIANSASPAIVSCAIVGNTSLYAGGGVSVHNWATPRILCSVIAANSAGNGTGGGVTTEKWSATAVVHCTIVANTAAFAGGVRIISDCPGAYCPSVTNSILWDNSPDQLLTRGGTSVPVTFNDIRGGWPGTGNIDIDPEFVNAAAGDYHLDWSSPCLDAGNLQGSSPAITDIDGDPRVIRHGPDLGADEAATVALIVSIAGGALEVRNVALSRPGDAYFTAITADPANAGGNLGSGPWLGLHIPLAELFSELFSGTPPFVGVLDGNGFSTWTTGGLPPSLSGASFYAVTAFHAPATAVVTAATVPVAFTFP